MIKELHLKNWKSFGDTILYIEPVTVLMGLNASGKSNAIDALAFLQRTITMYYLAPAFTGNVLTPPIRGGTENAAKHGSTNFSISILAEVRGIDYFYEIVCEVKEHHCGVIKEKLEEYQENSSNILLFEANNMVKDNLEIQCRYTSTSGETKLYPSKFNHNNVTVLNQLKGGRGFDKGLLAISNVLENIFILDVQPNSARNYSKITDKLHENGSNVAGFIAGLLEKEQKEVIAKILHYAKQLPEKEFTNIFVDKVGRLESDAMLYVEESFFEGKRVADTQTLSEGTLRFIIILTAILTRPAHSLLVIEEIDNGIHPSRASLLLEILLKESKERNIDILVTTHNEAFLNVLTPHLLAFVMYVHRDKTGNSIITPVDEIEELPRLLAQGNLGDVVANKRLHHLLNGE